MLAAAREKATQDSSPTNTGSAEAGRSDPCGPTGGGSAPSLLILTGRQAHRGFYGVAWSFSYI